MTLKKPASIAANAFKSSKWDEITSGRSFTESDIPTLCLLCHWHQVAEQCVEDTTAADGSVSLVYLNKLDDVKALPQVGMLKQASAEIRALNKQLGINDEAHADAAKPKETKLYAIQGNRQSRAAAARVARAK